MPCCFSPAAPVCAESAGMRCDEWVRPGGSGHWQVDPAATHAMFTQHHTHHTPHTTTHHTPPTTHHTPHTTHHTPKHDA